MKENPAFLKTAITVHRSCFHLFFQSKR